jgi:hypothetical protein
VVKPALVEISIYPDKKVEVVIDLSLEAAMTGIGTQYKNYLVMREGIDQPGQRLKRYGELGRDEK